MPTGETVRAAVLRAKETNFGGAETKEIAFFGGSFTALERDKMTELLAAAYPFVQDGTVDGIRVSTRPDFINLEILYLLKSYGVSAVELGAQSMDDAVLTFNRRGHSARQVEDAMLLLKAYRMETGLQMMTGLLGDTPEKAMQTAERLAALSPDTVRIYPLIVLRGTYLEALYNHGSFRPQTLDEAVSLCSRLLLFFEDREIPVIRLGLHEVEQQAVAAGPWHPAFSELCESRIYLEKLTALFADQPAGAYIIRVARGELSKAVGHHKSNRIALKKLGKQVRFEEKEGLIPRELEWAPDSGKI